MYAKDQIDAPATALKKRAERLQRQNTHPVLRLGATRSRSVVVTKPGPYFEARGTVVGGDHGYVNVQLRLPGGDVQTHNFRSQQLRTDSPTDEDEAEEWLTTGSDWIGTKLLREFDGRQFEAEVTAWLPEGDEKDEPALYKVRHTVDGDMEDLEESELIESRR